MKKLLLCLGLVIGLISPIDIIAQNTDNDGDEIIIFELSEDEIETAMNEQIEQLLAQIPQTFSETYWKYDYETVATQSKTAKGYAGGQPSGGVQFPSGGGFYYVPEGGPTVSLSFGASFEGFSLGVSIGSASSSFTGTFATAPNKTDYFKLYAEKTITVEKVAVYGYPQSPQAPRVFLYYMYPTVNTKWSAYAKKV